MKDIFDIFESIITITAIVLGGIWTYYKFFKGRTFAPRIEPQVSGYIFKRGKFKYLIAKIELKNNGSSKVYIKQEGSGLDVKAYRQAKEVNFAKNVEQEYIATFPVMQMHEWIEPVNTIHEQRLIVLPDSEYAALRLELSIIYEDTLVTSTSVIDMEPKKEIHSGENIDGELQYPLEATIKIQKSEPKKSN